MDLNLLLNSILRKLWLIILIPIITGVSTYLNTMNMEKKYKSVAQIATGFTQRSEIDLTDERFSLYEADVKFNNIIENLNSQHVMGMLSYRLLIDELKGNTYRLNNSENAREIINQTGNTRTIIRMLENKLDSMTLLSSRNSTERNIQNLLANLEYDYDELRKLIYVSRVNNTDYIYVVGLTENPQLSSFIVNTLVDEFLRFHKSLRDDRSSFSVEFLQSLVNQKKEELQKASDRLEYFKRTNNFIDVEVESETRITQITFYENLKNDKEAEIKNLTFALADINDRLENISETSNPLKTNTKIIQLQNRIDLLNEKYAKSNFSDKVLLDSINLLRELRRNEISITKSNTKDTNSNKLDELLSEKRETEVKLKMSKENLRDIEYKIDALRQNISSFASDQATFAGLQREIDLATQEYLDAQEKFNAAQNKSLVKESNIKQVLMAQPALEPESSKRLIIIAIAVVASFAFTLIVFIVLELMDLSIRTASIYKRNTKLKLIGVLNDLKVKNVNFEKIFSSEQNVEKTKKFKHLLRKIRFDINNSNSKIVLFTSTKNGEGKSFVLFSIAYSFSLMQKRVLIIDTNFRNNSLTNFLIPKSSTKYLLGAHENENWHGANGDNEPNLVSNNLQKNIIKRTSFKGIDVVGNNGLNLSPSEVFVNRDFKLLLKELATEYDFIFMEGSALNDFSDSKELIEYVDKVVAVFSARSTIKDIDKESIAYLSGINSKFLGGILNFVENKHLDI